jgi:hypothetical protein
MEFVLVVLLLALGWLWLDSLKAREAGIRAGHEACAAEGLQLLDDTVSIAGLKLVRDGEGRIRLQRVYDFEYSDTGNNRLKGSVVMLGHRVLLLNVGLRDVPDARTLH